MDLDELLGRLQPWFDRHVRPAWRPVTEPGEDPSSRSKFSGAPWIPVGEEWPRCRHCGEPIPLFLQLDLDALPEELGRPFGSGLLQLFYCTNEQAQCEQACEGWAPFSDAHLLRIVTPAGGPRTDLVPDPKAPPARTIVGWERFDDAPQAEEFEGLGLSIGFDDRGPGRYSHITVACPEVGLSESGLPASYWDDERLSRCASGDKLAGWPNWVQGAEYPTCPRCGARMRPVFQLDSEDNLDFMFGDVGCGHITQCPDHPDVLAFGWACC